MLNFYLIPIRISKEAVLKSEEQKMDCKMDFYIAVRNGIDVREYMTPVVYNLSIPEEVYELLHNKLKQYVPIGSIPLISNNMSQGTAIGENNK